MPFRKLEFPRYGEESSALLRLYLNGAFGTDPADVNAYAAATFYSVDRFASYKQDWGSLEVWCTALLVVYRSAMTSPPCSYQPPQSCL